ncbi:hypothetical protein [Deinococcus aquiradiocola]|uniref:Glycosyl transferase n=1 Tax=Deinococcus aquiradiocola TaxID=393059 RepID=A0A917PKA9_9DEIO|nr:hypothetical protein [Deinococcus aquiradiocola]GGJ82637.1 glycosyl transferase [Deinococcus aquiradiocola]
MKILYLMHIEWGWIKQRPHFIAEELESAGNKVDVRYETSLRRFKRLENKSDRIKPKRLIPIPKKRHYPMRFLDIVINTAYVYILHKRKKYDVIWICHPGLVQYVYHLGIPIIYDCMDDHVEFHGNRKDRNFLIETEDLACSVSTVIVSSNYLKKKIAERYGSNLNVSLVRNGLSQSIASKFHNFYSMLPESDLYYTIVYFGAIAEWFDFGAIQTLLQSSRKKIKIVLIGPSEVDLPKEENLIYTGPMDHESMMVYAGKADALIMPFKLSELIYGVDPVKLYEYICFNKPVFSIYYEEIFRFEKFVYFYKTYEELCLLVESTPPAKGSDLEKLDFIKENTWENRTKEIEDVIGKNV